jgi:hypothetical protein
MDIDRYVELHGRRQQTIIARVIEEAALGRAVDERTDKPRSLTARTNSTIAASGLCIGSTSNPAKHSG